MDLAARQLLALKLLARKVVNTAVQVNSAHMLAVLVVIDRVPAEWWRRRLIAPLDASRLASCVVEDSPVALCRLLDVGPEHGLDLDALFVRVDLSVLRVAGGKLASECPLAPVLGKEGAGVTFWKVDTA
eukprot:5169106-Prymnesium_polylepis.1